MMRVGIGVDFHRFAHGRKLFIGGVEIPHNRGLEGHSDADVLLHAICDALLGAAGLGDLGIHFPASDSRYRDISSLILLGQVKKLLSGKSYQIENLDAMILAEQPLLAPYFEAMKEKISQVLKISPQQINLKATRTEGLGLIGQGEGVMAQAVALITIQSKS
jgi:2-C-methyl-D-erythritol 2,4-cyclodiphosphate synthase